MSRILLVHPPYREPETLPVAMAGAALALRRAGHQVTSLDANQAFWRLWLSRDFLAARLDRVHAGRRAAEAAPRIAGETAFRYYRALRASVGGTRPLAELPRARDTLADHRASAAERAWAKRIVENALDLALWPVAGVATPNDLTLAASTESSADVLRVAHSTGEDNPFAGFWASWLAEQLPAATDELVLWLEADQQLVPAATLAATLAARPGAPRVVAAGPFAAFLRRLPVADEGCPPWWHGLFDDLGCRIPEIEPDPTRLAAELRTLATGRWDDTAPRIVALEPDAADLRRLEPEMAAATAILGDVVFHLPTPTPVAGLAVLIETLSAWPRPPRWGAVVKFGFQLGERTARALRAAGCEYLHFEIKGFSGYRGPEDAALSAMLTSFQAARRALAITHIFPSQINALLASPRSCPSVLSCLKALHVKRPCRAQT